MDTSFYLFKPHGATQENLYINDINARGLELALGGEYSGVVVKDANVASLDVLKPFKEKIKRLTLEWSCKNIEVINHLINLERLHLPGPNHVIDFGKGGVNFLVHSLFV